MKVLVPRQMTHPRHLVSHSHKNYYFAYANAREDFPLAWSSAMMLHSGLVCILNCCAKLS